MTDGAASGNSGRSNQYGGNVPRRLSYASVASGAPTYEPQLTPTRSGTFAHLVGANPSTSSLPIYHTIEQYNRRPSAQDADPHYGRAGVNQFRCLLIQESSTI